MQPSSRRIRFGASEDRLSIRASVSRSSLLAAAAAVLPCRPGRRAGGDCGAARRADARPDRASIQLFRQPDDRIQVSTAPGADGIVRRIEVALAKAGGSSYWAGLRAGQQRRRADRPPAGGAAFPPRRLRAVLARPRRLAHRHRSRRARASRRSASRARRRTSSASRSIPARSSPSSPNCGPPTLPQLYLWDADAYKDSVNSYTLYRGIVLGISGLLALFLTIVFVVKGTAMFPATAALAWSVLIYLCIDFGFWNRVIDVSPGERPDLARRRRGVPRRLAGHLHLHLSQPQPLACALQPPDHRLADRPRRPARRRGRSSRRSRPASPASRSALTAVARLRAHRLPRHRTATTAPSC